MLAFVAVVLVVTALAGAFLLGVAWERAGDVIDLRGRFDGYRGAEENDGSERYGPTDPGPIAVGRHLRP